VEPETPLQESKLLFCGVAQATGVPGRVPDHLHVDGLDTGNLSQVRPHVLADETVRRAAPGGECHHHVHAIIVDLDIVDQSQVDEIDGDFGVVARM